MKKLQNLMFACLLTLGLAACADDNKSSNNPPSYGDPTIIINDNHTAKINQTAEKTITFTNPFVSSAELDVSFNNYNNYNSYNSSITIDKTKSTCNFKTNSDGTTSNDILHTLQAGESCTLVYSFAPTKLDTELLKLSVDYRADIKTICPTPDTVPTYEQVRNSSRYEKWYIYNYAEDSNGNKSPEYINVEIPAEWIVSGSMIDTARFDSNSQDFNLSAKQGEYSFTISSGTLESNNDDCSISNDNYNNYTLSVNNNNGCSLKVTTSSGISPIKFIPTQEGNPYYNVNVEINTKYTYNLLDPNNSMYGSKFEPEYYASNIGENTYFDAGILKNGEKITSYKITGTDANKFKVAGTMHNSCTVTDTEISIPEGQDNCFYTIEITDKTTTAYYTATLNTTLSTGATQNYNIGGTVSLLTILDFMLQNYCEENTQSNKAYKLF